MKKKKAYLYAFIIIMIGIIMGIFFVETGRYGNIPHLNQSPIVDSISANPMVPANPASPSSSVQPSDDDSSDSSVSGDADLN